MPSRILGSTVSALTRGCMTYWIYSKGRGITGRGRRSINLGLEGDLKFLRASVKNTKREHGRKAGNTAIKAIEYLHRNKMYVVGGLIIGNPDDTRESIEANLEFARRYIDWPYIQHPTPYPRTPMTKDFRDRGLIINE